MALFRYGSREAGRISDRQNDRSTQRTGKRFQGVIRFAISQKQAWGQHDDGALFVRASEPGTLSSAARERDVAGARYRDR